MICRNGCKKSNRSAMRTKFILLPKDACLIENNGNSPDFWSVCLTCTAWILFSFIPMISRKLCGIFYLSIPVFIVHGIEEYLTGFTEVDSSFAFVFQPVLRMSITNGTFVVFQIMTWILLIVCALLLLGEHWQRRLLIISGILYIFEMHHLIEVIVKQSYYPGSLTATAFPVLAFFFWKEHFRTSPTP